MAFGDNAQAVSELAHIPLKSGERCAILVSGTTPEPPGDGPKKLEKKYLKAPAARWNNPKREEDASLRDRGEERAW